MYDFSQHPQGGKKHCFFSCSLRAPRTCCSPVGRPEEELSRPAAQGKGSLQAVVRDEGHHWGGQAVHHHQAGGQGGQLLQGGVQGGWGGGQGHTDPGQGGGDVLAGGGLAGQHLAIIDIDKVVGCGWAQNRM